MAKQFLVRPDTRAWVFQVWSAFVVAVLLCGVGLWNLPHDSADRAFLVVSCIFCVYSALTLAKTVRDNRDERIDTDLWIMQVWIAFVLAVASTLWGLVRIDLDVWRKGYFLSSVLFLVSSTFVLAKTVRDNHEAEVLSALPEQVPEPTS